MSDDSGQPRNEIPQGEPPEPPYPRAKPPAVLYHAVMPERLPDVLRHGLVPTGRPHVHLARRPEHARNAIRDTQDAATILRIDAAAMNDAGHGFYVSPKATWLVARVPPRFVSCVPR